MEEKEEILKVSPSYNLIYELGMPTGRKVKSALKTILFLIIIYVIGFLLFKYLPYEFSSKDKIKSILNMVMIVALVFFAIKLILHIVFQAVEYKNITYTFYDDYLEYKDMFLNQQTKVIRYANIREIELRRNLWERINGLGIIIIYNNAEKSTNNGLVIYGVKDSNNIHKKIMEIVNKDFAKNDSLNDVKDENYEANPEEKFKENLRNM